MDFGRYLLFRGYITLRTYQDVLSHQFGHGAGRAGQIDEIEDLSTIRPFPFGEILKSSLFADQLSATGRSLEELVDEWYEWHRGRLEPICSYSTTCKFGRELYARQAEKKYVAQHLVQATSPNQSTIIQNDDRIIITEGTSGFYVGLGIAEGLHDTTIITSNGSLLREYRDNPAVAQKFHKVCSVGGEVDYDKYLGRSEHDGIHGPMCRELESALREHPPATVVVVTGSFLSASAGPFTVGPTAPLKAEIVREALTLGLRKVVFIADYTKHVTDHGQIRGNQLFGSAEWRELVAKHKERIHIVTAPPPGVRALLASGQGSDVRNRKNLTDFAKPPIPFTNTDHSYNAAAHELQNLVGGEMVKHEFCSRFSEAYEDLFPTFPTVLTFIIDTNTGFSENAFRQEISRYQIPANPFHVNITQHNDQCRVSVIGWGTGGRPLRKLILQWNAEMDVGFAKRTCARNVSGSVSGTLLNLSFST